MGSRYSEVIGNLLKASVPIRQLGDRGKIAVTPAAGRVAAIAFSSEDENLLWSHPQLGETELVQHHPEKLVGGIGGDRLWFAPELAYHWDGKPDWATFGNYKTPTAMDPGKYRFAKQDLQSITLVAEGELPVHGASHLVGFEVERTIRLVEPPLREHDQLMSGVEYVGIESSHMLKFSKSTHAGAIGLWHLLQIPVGAVLVVPVKGTEVQFKPLSYGLPGSWVQMSDHIMWRYGGEARAKFGLSAVVLKGRSAVLRELEPARWCMIVRDFPVDPNARYADHPYNEPRTDQAFQAWDGYGFGEMEFHGPAIEAKQGPREIRESDRLWAFGGTPKKIAAIAARLLGVDVSHLF